MPWVRIPVGPSRKVRIDRLKWYSMIGLNPTTNAPSREKARMGRVDACTGVAPGRAYETVCTCDPDVHWIREPDQVILTTWLLCHSVDGSARELMKDVPSCDKLQGPAWRGRTGDFRMGIPTAIALRNGERRELKHLSTGRKRNQQGCR